MDIQKLNSLLDKILEDEGTFSKVMQCDDIDEVMKIFSSLEPGVSREDVMKCLEIFLQENALLQELSESDMGKISGGVNDGAKRFTATVLASLSILGTTPMGNNAYAAGTASSSVSNSRKANQTPKSGWQRFKKWVSDHKGAVITVGTLAVAAIAGVVAYNKSDTFKDKVDGAGESVKKFFTETVPSIPDHFRTYAIVNKGGKIVEVVKGKKAADKVKLAKGQSLIGGSDAEQIKIGNYLRDQNKGYGSAGQWLKNVLSASGVGIVSIGAWHLLKDVFSGMDSLPNKLNRIGSYPERLMRSFDKLKGVGKIGLKSYYENQYDAQESRKQLIEDLKSVKGQDEAVEQAIRLFDKVTLDKQRVKDNAKMSKKDDDKNSKLKRAYVAIFNGQAGIGKTYTAEMLAKALTPVKPFKFSAASLDMKSGQEYNPVQQMLMASSGNKDEESGSLYSYLYTNGSNSVVIIDEYDKIYHSGKKHPLDEVLRALIDNGEIDFGGYKIDAKGAVFICTTNETDSSLSGRIVYDENKKCLMERYTDNNGVEALRTPDRNNDVSRTETLVPHDASFINGGRIDCKAKFQPLSAEALTEIAKEHFADEIDYYKEKYAFSELRFADEEYNKIGAFVGEKHNGARMIDKEVITAFSDEYRRLVTDAQFYDVQLEGAIIETKFNVIDSKPRFAIRVVGYDPKYILSESKEKLFKTSDEYKMAVKEELPNVLKFIAQNLGISDINVTEEDFNKIADRAFEVKDVMKVLKYDFKLAVFNILNDEIKKHVENGELMGNASFNISYNGYDVSDEMMLSVEHSGYSEEGYLEIVNKYFDSELEKIRIGYDLDKVVIGNEDKQNIAKYLNGLGAGVHNINEAAKISVKDVVDKFVAEQSSISGMRLRILYNSDFEYTVQVTGYSEKYYADIAKTVLEEMVNGLKDKYALEELRIVNYDRAFKNGKAIKGSIGQFVADNNDIVDKIDYIKNVISKALDRDFSEYANEKVEVNGFELPRELANGVFEATFKCDQYGKPSFEFDLIRYSPKGYAAQIKGKIKQMLVGLKQSIKFGKVEIDQKVYEDIGEYISGIQADSDDVENLEMNIAMAFAQNFISAISEVPENTNLKVSCTIGKLGPVFNVEVDDSQPVSASR